MSSSRSWLSLHEDKKHDIDNVLGQGYRATANVNSSHSFRIAFETFCKKRGAHKTSRLETPLFSSSKHITGLAKEVGKFTAELHQLAPTNTLESLVWRISFALIECGYKAGAKLVPLVALMQNLNNTVPNFSDKVGEFHLRFPKEKRVQKPLQDVYCRFIDAYLFIINEFKKTDPTPNKDPSEASALQDYITETASRFAEARGKYDVMITHVAEDKEREERDLEQPSLDATRNLPDLVHQNSTSTREVQVRFVSQKFLGRGSYGDVDEVRELSTGASYARKHIHLDTDKPPETTANEVKNEVLIMQKLRHSHIATVLFYLKEEMAYSIFMLPVADYDLREYLNICTKSDYSPVQTKQIYPWFGCLLDALAYAHKLKIKHQDIKPSNILIKHHQPYLCDFGLAKDFAETDTSASRGHKVQGNSAYRAPEVIPNQNRGRKADVFALGCVYSEMFTVTHGRSVENYRDARQETGSTAFRDCLSTVESWLRSFEQKGLSALLIDQILSMIDKNVEKRHTAEQALNFLKQERALFCVE